jgi:hypothetical protein
MRTPRRAVPSACSSVNHSPLSAVRASSRSSSAPSSSCSGSVCIRNASSIPHCLSTTSTHSTLYRQAPNPKVQMDGSNTITGSSFNKGPPFHNFSFTSSILKQWPQFFLLNHEDNSKSLFMRFDKILRLTQLAGMWMGGAKVNFRRFPDVLRPR